MSAARRTSLRLFSSRKPTNGPWWRKRQARWRDDVFRARRREGVRNRADSALCRPVQSLVPIPVSLVSILHWHWPWPGLGFAAWSVVIGGRFMVRANAIGVFVFVA